MLQCITRRIALEEGIVVSAGAIKVITIKGHFKPEDAVVVLFHDLVVVM
jgi:hypothetical protein